MYAIPSDFDPRKMSHIENLFAVLGFIRHEPFDVKVKELGEIPEPIWKYIEQFKEENRLFKEEGLSPVVIDAINAVWIKEKYSLEAYISQLHHWLTTLAYKIAAYELEKRIIGDSTHLAIQYAQKKYKLDVTGELSVELENALRADYEAKVQQNDQNDLLKISDANRLKPIVAPLSINDKGEQVQVLQVALAWLGYAVYRGDYRAAIFGKQTRLAVIAYQKDHDLEPLGLVSKEMAKLLNEQLLISKPSLLDDKDFYVRGLVKDAEWNGISNAIVEVYEQVLRDKPLLLEEGVTEKNGSYNINYAAPIDAATKKEKERFHLLVRLKDREGTLLKEATFYNVSLTTWLNYTAGKLAYSGKSIYEENMDLLAPSLGDLKLEEVEESDLNRDVEYLNASSGVGGNEILRLSLAHRIAMVWSKYKIDPSVIYAFFKQHLPATLPSYLLPDELSEWNNWIGSLVETQMTALALMPRATQKVALEKAVNKKILPIAQSNQLESILNQFEAVRNSYAQSAPIIGRNVSLDYVLEEARIDKKEQKVVIEKFGQNPSFSLDFIDQLAQNNTVSKNTEKALRQEFFLLELGNQEKEASNKLKSVFGQDGYSKVVKKVSDFAKWSKSDWQTYVENTTSLDGSGQSALKAEDLYYKAVNIAPTVATIAQLEKSGINSLENLATLDYKVDKEQWLNLTKVPLLALAQNSESEISEAALEDLKTLQRVQKIAPSPESAAILIDKGVQSAQKAFSMGTSALSDLLEEGGIAKEYAELNALHVFTMAQQQVGAVMGLGTAIQMIGNNELPTNVLPRLVNIEDLFGSTDTCACAHCSSVYSPAAYLTDLLQWLKQRDGNKMNVLLARRPDLEHILLNCQNAHTPLPYVDLVNEALEYAISKDANYIERNTSWEAAALRLQPEHQLDTVYEGFAALPLPNSTTFKPTASYSALNLWQSQFHLYLERLGIDAYELVKEWGHYGSSTNKAIAEAAAYFQMPSHEAFDIVTNNYDYGNHAAASSNAEQFLKHHDLTYEQLVELLQCSAATGGAALRLDKIDPNDKDSCSLSNKQIVGLTNVAYSSLWRFLRLWKYTGWELSELNKVILHPSVGQGSLTFVALSNLVQFHQLQQQFNASVEQLLAVFGDLNNAVWIDAKNKEQVGLYQRVYLAPNLEKSQRTFFEVNSSALDLNTLSSEQINYIATALGSSISAVRAILDLPILSELTKTSGATTVKAAGNLTGLSNLYAYTFLAKALNIEVESLVVFGQTLDASTNVFQDVTTFQKFIENWKSWKTKGIAIDTVLYILKDQEAEAFLNEYTVEEWNETLFPALEEAYDALLETTDVDRVLLRNLLRRTNKFLDPEGQVDATALETFLDIIMGKLSPLEAAFKAQAAIYFDYIDGNAHEAIVNAAQASDVQNEIFPAVGLVKQALHSYLNRETLYRFLSNKFGLSTELLKWFMEHNAWLINGILANTFIPTYGEVLLPSAVIQSYRYVQKFALLVEVMNLSLEEVKALEKNGALLNLIVPSKLPANSSADWTIEKWNNTLTILDLCRQNQVDLSDFIDLLSNLNGNSGNFTIFFREMEQHFPWDFDLLKALHMHFAWSATDYLQAEHYQKACSWMARIKRSGESFDVVKEWPTIFDVSATDYLSRQKRIATEAKQSLQNSLSPEQWALEHQKVQDKIRVQKRDALVAYARNFAPDNMVDISATIANTSATTLSKQKEIAKESKQRLEKHKDLKKWLLDEEIRGELQKDKALMASIRYLTPHYNNNNNNNDTPVLLSVNELYKYYLIDPAMSACQYTSRIKQAISSVQLFIQRCLMGLEGTVEGQGDPVWKQWKWMQSYRVWEANRKVFLYPENWIEPALRDNKTELFKEFEEKLLQSEVTNENVERNLQEYLVKLQHISNLEMKSICQEPDDKILYVLARTKESPADYYYRKLDKTEGAWTGWEKVDGGIKGEHPVLQWYNGKLHIFWLEILEKPQKVVVHHENTPSCAYKKQAKMDGHTTEVTANKQPEPANYKEIQLAWTVLYDTGWAPPTLSKETLVHPWPRPNRSLHLRPRLKYDDTIKSVDLWLDIYVSTSIEFDNRKFYNQFSNEYESLHNHPSELDVSFDENSRPWHSSSFVFDGFVRNIRIRPIKGTFWYVGWKKNILNAGTPVEPTYINNQGPIWIISLEQRLASSFSYLKVHTNYGDFSIVVRNGRHMRNLNNLILNTKVSNAPQLVLDGRYTTRNGETKCHVKVGNVWLYLTKDQLNNYIHRGVGNVSPRLDRPAHPVGSPPSEVYELVPTDNPNKISYIDNSNSQEYVYHNFGEVGRKIKKMAAVNIGTDLLTQYNDFIHYEYNHLVVNKTDKESDTRLMIPFFAGLNIKGDTAFDTKLTIPMDGTLSKWGRHENVLYQDDFRSFYIEWDNTGGNAHAMYHPLVRDYIGALGSRGTDGLYDRGTQFRPQANLENLYDYSGFAPLRGDARGEEETLFDLSSGYAIYNWEIFFHIPMMIATELSKNQRFEEAMQWFHFIFNPIGVSATSPNAGDDFSKHWITKPFYKQTQQGYEDNLIQNILGGTLSEQTIKAINKWRKEPFQPYVLARMRPVAYQKAIVMKYVDNLVAWGDQLFRRETLESINQAALRYMMAAEILGDAPETLAAKESIDKDYASIKAALNEFSNTEVPVQLENAAMGLDYTHDIYIEDNLSRAPIPQLSQYFCIPKNEKLAAYWDLVGDRLFKIRNCMNIDGVVRQLPLFAPPIDPALLVNAAANGIDLSTVLDDLSLPKLHYKYRALGRLAVQFCSEVKGLGQSLLSALQSKDAEGMALLQSSNALRLMNATVSIKNMQIQEAEESIKSLELSRAAAEFRKEFYKGRSFMNKQEKKAEAKNKESIALDAVGMVSEGIAGVVAPIPEIKSVASMMPAIHLEVVDGSVLAKILQIASGILFRTSGIRSKEAGMAATQGSYRRRQEEWDMQAELAIRDIEQIDQQIATAKIRVDIAKKDLENHRLQMENAESEREYMQSKYTNQQLYSWMIGQISGVYFQAYQLAYDMAKKAEKSMRYELALPTDMPSMIQFGYWDSMKKGLLAGDKLMLAINQMEANYIERNSRELELTKHISMHQLAPKALMDLKTKGECTLTIPEWWFDLDYPGHYLRRIKTLSVSIPCVTGPNTNVNCKLTMTTNTIKDKDNLPRENFETQSIATSSAQNDAGVFELNLNGERYLPFEGAGVISSWTLSLPEIPTFDYQSISDVVLHLRYTAKDGGAIKATKATEKVQAQLETAQGAMPPVVLLSLKGAFPTAWHRFIEDKALSFELLNKHYPYMSSLFKKRTIDAAEVGILLKETPVSGNNLNYVVDAHTKSNTNTNVAGMADFVNIDKIYTFMSVDVSKSDLGDWKLDFANSSSSLEEIEDVFLILKYKVEN